MRYWVPSRKSQAFDTFRGYSLEIAGNKLGELGAFFDIDIGECMLRNRFIRE